MPTVLLFASIAQAAGTRRARIEASTLAGVLSDAARRFGDAFAEQLPHCRLAVNGEPVDLSSPMTLGVDDEVAILPPVSGG